MEGVDQGKGRRFVRDSKEGGYDETFKNDLPAVFHQLEGGIERCSLHAVRDKCGVLIRSALHWGRKSDCSAWRSAVDKLKKLSESQEF